MPTRPWPGLGHSAPPLASTKVWIGHSRCALPPRFASGSIVRSFLVGLSRDGARGALSHKPVFHAQSCQPRFASMSTLKIVVSIHSEAPGSSPGFLSSADSIPLPFSHCQSPLSCTPAPTSRVPLSPSLAARYRPVSPAASSAGAVRWRKPSASRPSATSP